MRILPLILTLSLTASFVTLHAESKVNISDDIHSMESDSEYKDRADLLNKFNKLSLEKQRLLFLYLVLNEKYKNITDIKIIIDSGFDINFLKRGYSPLHYAMAYMNIDVINILLENGANTEQRTSDEETALHLAIETKDLGLIKLLIKHGADLEARDGNKETALKSAVRTGRIEILEYLINQGSDVNAIGKSDTTPLTTATYKGDKEAIELLVKHGANIHHTKQGNQWTLLHYAANYNHTHLIDYLIESGIDVNARSKNGWSALALASDEGDIEIVEKLIKHQADIELSTIKSKKTPLMAAATNGHTNVVSRLIKAGADHERKNTDGHNSLWLAANKSHTDTVKVLLKLEKNHNQVFFDASSKGKFELVRTLIKSGIDVSARTKKGSTAMHLAARYGHLDIVKLLQKNGADIHALSTNKNDTPLMRAAGWGQRNVIDYLISQDTEVDIQTKHGWTAALSTARHHKLDTLKLFIEHGADIRKTTNSGWTILMLAAKGKKYKTMEFLLQQDLDLNLKNNKGHTALDIAIKSKDKKIIEMLKKASASKDLITST